MDWGLSLVMLVCFLAVVLLVEGAYLLWRDTSSGGVRQIRRRLRSMQGGGPSTDMAPLLKSRAGIAPVHVPYPGYPQVFNAMMAGDLHLSMLPPALANAQIRAGKLRPLAVSSTQRSSALPDVPTLAELKLGKATFDGFYGLAAPAGTPAAIQQLLGREVAAIMALPDVKEKMLAAGLEPGFLDAPAFSTKVAEEIATFSAAGKRAHIVME